MGCSSSRSLPPRDTNTGSRSLVSKPSGKSQVRIDVGRPVGGGELGEDKRAAQLAAAERRAAAEAQRGLGRGSTKALEQSEWAQKQELIGKIEAHYRALNKEIPMGLNLAVIEQLKKHLEAVRKAPSSL